MCFAAAVGSCCRLLECSARDESVHSVHSVVGAGVPPDVVGVRLKNEAFLGANLHFLKNDTGAEMFCSETFNESGTILVWPVR